jgi:hypothetical protein
MTKIEDLLSDAARARGGIRRNSQRSCNEFYFAAAAALAAKPTACPSAREFAFDRAVGPHSHQPRLGFP